MLCRTLSRKGSRKGKQMDKFNVEKLNLYDAIDQAKADSGKNDLPFGYDVPAVFHRKNNCEWLVTMCLDDWMDLYQGRVGD